MDRGKKILLWLLLWWYYSLRLSSSAEDEVTTVVQMTNFNAITTDLPSSSTATSEMEKEKFTDKILEHFQEMLATTGLPKITKGEVMVLLEDFARYSASKLNKSLGSKINSSSFNNNNNKNKNINNSNIDDNNVIPSSSYLRDARGITTVDDDFDNDDSSRKGNYSSPSGLKPLSQSTTVNYSRDGFERDLMVVLPVMPDNSSSLSKSKLEMLYTETPVTKMIYTDSKTDETLGRFEHYVVNNRTDYFKIHDKPSSVARKPSPAVKSNNSIKNDRHPYTEFLVAKSKDGVLKKSPLDYGYPETFKFVQELNELPKNHKPEWATSTTSVTTTNDNNYVRDIPLFNEDIDEISNNNNNNNNNNPFQMFETIKPLEINKLLFSGPAEYTESIHDLNGGANNNNNNNNNQKERVTNGQRFPGGANSDNGRYNDGNRITTGTKTTPVTSNKKKQSVNKSKSTTEQPSYYTSTDVYDPSTKHPIISTSRSVTVNVASSKPEKSSSSLAGFNRTTFIPTTKSTFFQPSTKIRFSSPTIDSFLPTPVHVEETGNNNNSIYHRFQSDYFLPTKITERQNIINNNNNNNNPYESTPSQSTLLTVASTSTLRPRSTPSEEQLLVLTADELNDCLKRRNNKIWTVDETTIHRDKHRNNDDDYNPSNCNQTAATSSTSASPTSSTTSSASPSTGSSTTTATIFPTGAASSVGSTSAPVVTKLPQQQQQSSSVATDMLNEEMKNVLIALGILKPSFEEENSIFPITTTISPFSAILKPPFTSENVVAPPPPFSFFTSKSVVNPVIDPNSYVNFKKIPIDFEEDEIDSTRNISNDMKDFLASFGLLSSRAADNNGKTRRISRQQQQQQQQYVYENENKFVSAISSGKSSDHVFRPSAQLEELNKGRSAQKINDIIENIRRLSEDKTTGNLSADEIKFRLENITALLNSTELNRTVLNNMITATVYPTDHVDPAASQLSTTRILPPPAAQSDGRISSSTIINSPNPLSTEELKQTYEDDKNDVKRQQPTIATSSADDGGLSTTVDNENNNNTIGRTTVEETLSAATPAISTSETGPLPPTIAPVVVVAAADNNAPLPELAASFGGGETASRPPSPQDLPTPRPNGLYFYLDWNSFLNVGEADKRPVNIRFAPKAGNARNFIPITFP